MSTSTFSAAFGRVPQFSHFFAGIYRKKRGLPQKRQAPHCVQHLQNGYGSVAVVSTFLSRYRSSTRFSVSKRLLYWTLS